MSKIRRCRPRVDAPLVAYRAMRPPYRRIVLAVARTCAHAHRGRRLRARAHRRLRRPRRVRRPGCAGWGRYARELLRRAAGRPAGSTTRSGRRRARPRAVVGAGALPRALRRRGAALVHAPNCFLPLRRPVPGRGHASTTSPSRPTREDFSPRTGLEVPDVHAARGALGRARDLRLGLHPRRRGARATASTSRRCA